LAVERIGARRAQDAFVKAYEAACRAVGMLSDEELLFPSRCRGWAVCDVVCHLHIGVQDVLVALASTTDEQPDTDYVSYWQDWTPGGDEALAHARFVRLVASAYRESTSLVAHFETTARAAMRRAQEISPDVNVAFQGKVLQVADFLTTFAVEAAIHHLDLTVDLPHVESPPRSALTLVRLTLDGLLSQPVGIGWDDQQYALKGTGRLPLTEEEMAALGPAADRLPVFG
jgi:hypothetical protein